MPVYNHFYFVDGQPAPNDLQHFGPTIPVEISVPTVWAEQLIKDGKAVPNPINGVALVDTGASVTAVDVDILTSLGINPLSTVAVHTPSGSHQQNIYPAKISFPGTTLPTIEFDAVLGSVLKSQGIIALLGRTLLSNFVLVFNGPGGFITLSY